MDRLSLSFAALRAYFKKAHRIERESHIAYMLGISRQAVNKWAQAGVVPETSARAIIDTYPALACKARRRPQPRKGGRVRV